LKELLVEKKKEEEKKGSRDIFTFGLTKRRWMLDRVL
jgi:hypothetical protein